jgi:membrane-associated phospholipid phosphatase
MNRFLNYLRPWRQIYDWFGIVYLVLSGLLPLLNPACFNQVAKPGPLHAPGPHLGFHLLLAAAVYVVPPLLRSRPQWPLRLLGIIYLPMMLPLFYVELEFLGVIFFPYGQSFDPWLIALEQRIFGFQPSLQWSRAWPWPWLLEIMQFAYFSYYFIAALVLFLIWREGNRSAARNWALSAAMTRDLSAVMLSCYIWFAVFPVWGPKYFDYQGIAGTIASEGLHGWLFTNIMTWLHAHGALHGAAFPSSHVAGSLVVWWWGWKLAPRHRWWLTSLWILLGLSIVYCRYHYVVDLVAGLAWGTLVVWLVNRLLPMPADGLRLNTAVIARLPAAPHLDASGERAAATAAAAAAGRQARA